MKSIIILLVICAGLASAELNTFEQKGIATDFLVDNVLNPLLSDIKNNTLNFITSQLTSSLLNLIIGGFGKRAVISPDEYLQQVNLILNEFRQAIDVLCKKFTDALRQLNKDELVSFLQSMKQEIEYQKNKFLSELLKFLTSIFGQVLIGKPKSVYDNITSIVGNFTNNLLNGINNTNQILAGKF